jgi:hypothetical protein
VILFFRGKYEDALDVTMNAYTVNSHEPITNYFLGNLLVLTKNNHTAAQEYYRRSLAIDPMHIYARRQLRLSYCFTMHKTWEMLGCTDNNDDCHESNVRPLSIKCSVLSQHINYMYDSTLVFANSQRYSHAETTPCMCASCSIRSQRSFDCLGSGNTIL